MEGINAELLAKLTDCQRAIAAWLAEVDAKPTPDMYAFDVTLDLRVAEKQARRVIAKAAEVKL